MVYSSEIIMFTRDSKSLKNRLKTGLAVAALCAASLAAAPAAHAQSWQSWMNQSTMTGGWNGGRAKLAAIGITPRASYVGEFADITSGGKKQGNGYAQQFVYGMDVDLGKLAGLDGTVFHITFNTRQGRNTSADFIGNKLSVQEVYGAGETTRLADLSLDKSLDGNLIALKGGFYPMGNDFGVITNGCDFQNVGFCAHPQNLPNSSGWSDNPTAKWGGRIRLNPTPAVYVESGVYDVNPTYGARGNGLKISTSGSTGALIPLEAGYTTAFGSAHLPGHYKIGGYYETSAVADAVTAHQLDDGRYGGYILVDQMVLSFDGTANRGLIAEAQASISDPRTAVFESTIGAELIAQGPFDARPNDYIELGYMRAGINHRNIQAEYAKLAAQNITTESLSQGEGALEVGYGFAATPWLTLHPNLQYIMDPGTFSYKHVPNAWVLGFQTKVTF